MSNSNIIEENNSSPVKDLTSGSPLKLIISFTIPILFGMIFQQLYSMVDTMIVGKYLGVEAFAGVGAAGSLNFLVIGFCMGICNGFAIPVAQMLGARNYDGLRKYVANIIWLCIAFSIVITCAVVILCKQMLVLMDTPENIFKYAYLYIVIIFAGIPFTILYNVTASIIRSLGDSKSPLVFLAISSVINIILDIVFIVNFGMNVEGAALATVISQGVSGIACVVYMKNKFEVLSLKKEDMKLDVHFMAKLVSVGLPMGLQYSITAIGSIILQSAVNGLGSMYVAAVTSGFKIYTLISCPVEALGQTMAPYAGQNVGAGKLDRVGKGIKCAGICGFIMGIITLLTILLFGRDLTLIFLDEKNDDVSRYAFRFLLYMVAFYSAHIIVNVVRFSIQGMGYSTFAIIAGVLEMIARAVAGMVLTPMFGFVGICLASPLAWVLADTFLIPAFFVCKKRIKRTVGVTAS